MLPTKQKNPTEFSVSDTGQPPAQSPNQTEDENQSSPRLTILRGIPIKTEVESMNRILRASTCINIGAQGALLDLGEDKGSDLPVDSKLFVIIQLAGETAKLPGIVRHRQGNQLGIFFPIEDDPNYEEERKTFARIFRTLERGIERRTRR